MGQRHIQIIGLFTQMTKTENIKYVLKSLGEIDKEKPKVKINLYQMSPISGLKMRLQPISNY